MELMRSPYDAAVRQHGSAVLRVCRAVLGSDAEAEDAWSETFLAALRAWPQLPGDTDVRAWLVTVAHHKAVDVIRRRAVRAVPFREPPEPATTHPNPDLLEESLDLRRAVARLPEKQRLCVTYHHLGGLPYLAVAEIVGGTPEAARRAAGDGVAALRRRLRTQDQEES